MSQVTVYCVKVEGVEPGPVMCEAYEALSEMGDDLQCKWLPEEDCFKLTKREKLFVYMFEEFGSKAFYHVVATDNKAYGPMCILACMKKSEPLPTSHPIYCLAMKGLVISCTSVPKDQRESVHRQIEWMSGKISRDFHDHVTHLVAGEVCSKKYRVAADLKKSIMSVEWVDGMLEASRTKLISATDPQYLKQYRCLVFKGLVITVSGVSGQERLQIQELVESEGGKYSGPMKMDECTHLVINQPGGSKYEFAKKWKLKIVQPKWVTDSIEHGLCLEEHKYKVDEGGGEGQSREAITSTPNRSTTHGTGDISQLGDVSAITMHTVEDTTLNFTANHSLHSSTQLMKQSPAADTLEGFNLGGWKGQMFLDGCKIFLSGFTSVQLDKLKKMLNIAGAFRFNDITENITHVVIGQKIEEHLKKIQDLSTRPHVVSVNWLVDGFHAKKCVPEELYYVLEAPGSDTTLEPQPKLKTSQAKPLKKDAEPSFQAPVTSVSKDQVAGMEDILSQYLPQASSLGESTLIRMADQAEVAAAGTSGATSGGNLKTSETTPQQQLNYEDAETQDPNDVTELQEVDDSFPFRGKTFVTIGFDEDQASDLHRYIVECGGEISPINTRRIPDYGVVPIMGFPVERTVGEVVTNAWLQISVEMDALQPVEANEIYTPLNPRDEAARPLEGVVLSISGYIGTERDVICHIAEILGATCQEFFVRKANQKKGLVGNTHLVVNAPEGSKFEAAVKWGIPAVEKSWVIACAKQSRRLDEADFLVNKHLAGTKPAAPTVTETKPLPTDSQEKMPPPKLPPVKKVTSPASVTARADNTRAENVEETSDRRRTSRRASKRSSESDVDVDIPVKRTTRNRTKSGSESNSDKESETTMDSESESKSKSDTKSNTEEEKISKCERKLKKKREDVSDNENKSESKSVSEIIIRKTSETNSERKDETKLQSESNSDEESETELSKNRKGRRKLPVDPHNIMEDQTDPEVEEFDGKDPSLGDGALQSDTGSPAPSEVVAHAHELAAVSLNTPKATLSNVVKTPGSAVNARVQKLIKENRASGKVPLPKRGSEGDQDGWETPSKFCKEGVVFKPKFDLEAAYACIDNMETPGRQPGDKRDSVSLEDFLSENLELAIKKTSVKPQATTQAPPRTEINSPAVLRECTPRPLSGVVIAVAKKLITRQTDYNNIASSLGAEYRWTYDKSCTHFIFQGKQNDMNKEFRLAREHKKVIVCPHWLLMCQEQNCRVDESLFPHTYNPNMSLSMSTTPARSVHATRTRSRLTRNQLASNDDTSTSGHTKTRTQTSINTETTTAKSRATRNSLRQKKTVTEVEKDSSEADTSKENIEQETDTGTGRGVGMEDPDQTQSDEEMSRICSEVELEENPSKSEALVNDLKNLMAASTKSYGKQRRKNRRSEVSFDQILQDENNTSGTKKSRPTSRNVSRVEDEENKSRNNSRCSSRNSNSSMPETQASQMMEVIWDDPKAREQQQKLASDLAKYQQSVSPTTEPVTTDRQQGRTSSALTHLDIDFTNPQAQRATIEDREDARASTPEAPPLAFPLVKTWRVSSPPRPVDVATSPSSEDGELESRATEKQDTRPPVFLMSGIPTHERNDYGALIEELGGEVVDVQNFDIRATHLAVVFNPSENMAGVIDVNSDVLAEEAEAGMNNLVEQPTRNEKFLASVAAGKWVVHKSYFEACRTEKKFVKPDCYEWGTEYTSSLCSGITQHKLAAAAHRWRLRMQEAKQTGACSRGAFSGWRVLLLTKKEESFCRLLEAGGARVIATRLPFNRLEDVTHAFLDLSKVKSDGLDFEALVSAGVECCKPEFIASYLTDNPPAEPRDFYVKGVSGTSEIRKRKSSAGEAPGTPKNKRKKQQTS